MKYAIMLTQGPVNQQSGLTALQFIDALYAKQHEVLMVFFHQDGVYHATHLALPPEDEPQLSIKWTTLATTHTIPLCCCSTSALRRGIIDVTQARHAHLNQYNMGTEFKLAGLGQWIEACMQADRVMVFK